MLILKLGMLSAGLYAMCTVLLQLIVRGVAYLKGDFGLYGTRSGWTVLFGAMWLISFWISRHIVLAGTGR